MRKAQAGRADEPLKATIVGVPILDVEGAETVLFVERGAGSENQDVRSTRQPPR